MTEKSVERNSSIRSIGILGGTFDPIHIGHIAIAKEAKERFNLDRVDLIPAFLNPLRERESIVATSHQRLIMANLASLEIPWMYVSDIEIERERESPGPSYTIDTIIWYRTSSPSAELTLIVGADNTAFHLWHRIEEFPEYLKRIAVVSRPGFSESFEKNLDEIRRMKIGIEEIIETIDDVAIPKSSTNVRISTKSGHIPIDHLHPDVEQFVKKYGLYGWENDVK